jgi:hypothetical protein
MESIQNWIIHDPIGSSGVLVSLVFVVGWFIWMFVTLHRADKTKPETPFEKKVYSVQLPPNSAPSLPKPFYKHRRYSFLGKEWYCQDKKTNYVMMLIDKDQYPKVKERADRLASFLEAQWTSPVKLPIYIAGNGKQIYHYIMDWSLWRFKDGDKFIPLTDKIVGAQEELDELFQEYFRDWIGPFESAKKYHQVMNEQRKNGIYGRY